MKQVALFLIVILLTGFTNSKQKDEPVFKIEIAYRNLPDPKTTEYSIDNKKMILNHMIYDNNEASYQSLDKSTYKDFDREKIITYLRQTNWSEVPARIGSATNEGPQYIVKIQLENQTYNFEIMNSYHPAIAGLFTACNEAIPSKEKRGKYSFPYNP